MQKFLKTSIIFIVILAGLLVIINILYNNFVIGNRSEKIADIAFENNFNPDKEILIMGDSIPFTDLNPSFINKAVNYCNGGESYEQTYYRARYALNKKNNIKLLVLPYNLHSFSDYRSNPYIKIWYWSKFLSAKELSELTRKPEAIIKLQIMFPFIGNGIELKNFSFKRSGVSKEGIVFNGWRKFIGTYKPTEDIDQAAIHRIKTQFNKYPEIIKEKLADSFLSLLDLAEEKDIKVVLIKFPITKNYLMTLEKLFFKREVYYEEINKYIQGRDNVYLLDYQDKYDNEMFYNTDHLNAGGAEIFSKEINKKLLEILNKKILQ